VYVHEALVTISSIVILTFEWMDDWVCPTYTTLNENFMNDGREFTVMASSSTSGGVGRMFLLLLYVCWRYHGVFKCDIMAPKCGVS
jgi:hypothetical protein